MTFRFYMVFLLVGLAAADKETEELHEGGQTPIRIWSINAELDMNQQIADVHMRGLRAMQTEPEEEKQYILRLDNSQTISHKLNDEKPATEPTKERLMDDDRVPATRRRIRKVGAIVPSACCRGCEAPLAVHILHMIAQAIGTAVVISMCLLVTAGIFIWFGWLQKVG